MTILLFAIGVVAIWLPGGRPASLLRHHPRAYARLATAAATTGLACILAALVLSVVVGVAHLSFGHQSASPAHLTPEGAPGALLAAMALVVLAVRGTRLSIRSARARRRALPERWLGTCEAADDHDVIVLPTAERIAFSPKARPRPQVVITEGLRRCLDDETLQLVIGHELAHARAADGTMLLLVRCLDTFRPIVPFTGRTAAAIRIAAERAADEEATGRDPRSRRRLAAHLIGAAGQSIDECIAGCGPYRARQLDHAPATALGPMATAIAGLTITCVAAGTVLVHIGDDLAPYLALLRP